MYRLGIGGKEDLNSAARYYKIGADLGDGLAAAALGAMHFQGDGVVQDLGIAAKYFKIGADLGNATAANNASSGAHAQTHTTRL